MYSPSDIVCCLLFVAVQYMDKLWTHTLYVLQQLWLSFSSKFLSFFYVIRNSKSMKVVSSYPFVSQMIRQTLFWEFCGCMLYTHYHTTLQHLLRLLTVVLHNGTYNTKQVQDTKVAILFYFILFYSFVNAHTSNTINFQFQIPSIANSSFIHIRITNNPFRIFLNYSYPLSILL